MTHAPGVMAVLEEAARELDARRALDRWEQEDTTRFVYWNGSVLRGVCSEDGTDERATSHVDLATKLGLLP